MLRGEQRLVEFTIKNEGGAPAENIIIDIPDADWLSLATPETISSLASEAETKVTLSLKPADDLSLGFYDGAIAINSDSSPISIPFTFNLISEAKGDLGVTVTDEYTYYTESAPNVSDASVTIRDYYDHNVIIENAMTDSSGTHIFNSISEGFYYIEVKADGHTSHSFDYEVVSGKFNEVNVYLSVQTISYNFEVAQIDFEDRYLISIESLFETDVPWPDVVIEPPIVYVDIDEKSSSTFELTITNRGLIQAENVKIEINQDSNFTMIPLVKSIPILPAKTSMKVPVSVYGNDYSLLSNSLNIAESDDLLIELSKQDDPASCRAGGGMVVYEVKCGKNQKCYIEFHMLRKK